MSAQELSATAVKHILSKVSKSLQTNIAKINADLIAKSMPGDATQLAKTTGGIRQLTSGPDREYGIITNNGFKILGDRFKDAITDPELLLIKPRDLDISRRRTRIIERLVTKYINSRSAQNNLKTYLIEELKKEFPDETDLKKDKNKLDSFKLKFNALISDLSKKTAQVFNTPNLADDFINYLKERDVNKNTVTQINRPDDVVGIVLGGHRELNRKFKSFIHESKGHSLVLAEFIDLNSDAGHLLGLFNQQLAFSTGGKIKVTMQDGIPVVSMDIFNPEELEESGDVKQELEFLNNRFSDIMSLAANADLISSNTLKDFEIFMETTKQATTAEGFLTFLASVELQLSTDNREGGRVLGNISKQMKELSNIAQGYNTKLSHKARTRKAIKATKVLSELFASTQSLGQYVENLSKELLKKDIYDDAKKKAIEELQRRSKEIGERLMNSAGSDTLIESIEKSMASILDKKQRPSSSKPTVVKNNKTVSTGKASGKKSPYKKPAIKSTTKTRLNNTLKLSGKTITPKPYVKKTATNLDVLLQKINSMIAQTVKQNMGTGTSNNLLNYRSGRFANSVKVEKLSESRQGMITAFYSYMKNPYATFSQGGRRQYPRSRDPKLLISKSIREIAQTMVTNQLRAVNV